MRPGAYPYGGTLFEAADRELLLTLLRTPTVNPLEAPGRDDADDGAGLRRAQHSYATAAEKLGMRIVRHGSPPAAAVRRADVPAAVRRAAEDPDFLARQPSLVLRMGPELPLGSTVMFNVHLDTVAGLHPVGFDGVRFTGRGAIDAKGPAVALLAGIRAALARHPAIGRDVAVLVQAVSGEEGGAMGTFGTRPLVEAGLVGRLNVFCEPTGLRYLPRATASMTACVRVDGDDAVDDRPAAGHNATVLLGFLAQHLARELDVRVPGGAVCVAGLHTGDLHNRVYGRGRLLLNLAYGSTPDGAAAERAIAGAVDSGLRAFARQFAPLPGFARTAADAARVTRLEWLKRGLPCLDNGDPWAEEVLARAGVARWPDHEPAFTCDAIWMAGLPGVFTTVLGPGSLDANRAHAPGEFADLADLESFAGTVARLLIAFAERSRHPEDPEGPERPERPESSDSPEDPEARESPETPERTST
ncbi:M20/M25/M40 family metallo-hydrolase [Streptomyces odontomachi]|uniref:M20/M25/M40 family metallo-hydrolase n=1 Tax=Streptomyces odontomachi TaxID=2944940 RepID=UPI00210B2F96|nr:M20/M25/M40 family metallo-hydrolase [Streptomyces sp. ODS25]